MTMISRGFILAAAAFLLAMTQTSNVHAAETETLNLAQQIEQMHWTKNPATVVPTKLLAQALAYFRTHTEEIENKDYMTIVDFAKASSDPRFYVISMKDGAVMPLHVAHGKGSDPDNSGRAQKFSNEANSLASSLGFYLTGDIYTSDKDGRALKVRGRSPTNSAAFDRGIIIHGADYVQEASVQQGRSWGCFAVAMPQRDRVINLLKNGSLLFAGLSH